MRLGGPFAGIQYSVHGFFHMPNTSTQGMETIHERKPDTNPSSYRPQELGNLHDDQGFERTTGLMTAFLKSIHLQKRISTWTRSRKTRRPHQKVGRSTHDRRQKTHKKCGNIATQGISKKRIYVRRTQLASGRVASALFIPCALTVRRTFCLIPCVQQRFSYSGCAWRPPV